MIGMAARGNRGGSTATRGAEDLQDLLEQHRVELTAYAYRMLGSSFEAEDAVQETLLRAWKGFEGFEGRAALRSWLYRIVTNVCLDMLHGRARRARPMDLGPAGTAEEHLLGERLPEVTWIEPIPDGHVLPTGGDPAEAAESRESIRLAFVAALQHLLARYVDAFERYDMDSLTSLLREDASWSMPPYELWLQTHEDVRRWCLGPGIGCRGSRLVPVEANGMPAYGQYKPSDREGILEPWSLQVVEVSGDRIAGITFFLDTQRLFPIFGLPPQLQR